MLPIYLFNAPRDLISEIKKSYEYCFFGFGGFARCAHRAKTSKPKHNIHSTVKV
jgi:hypothetical protein